MLLKFINRKLFLPSTPASNQISKVLKTCFKNPIKLSLKDLFFQVSPETYGLICAGPLME